MITIESAIEATLLLYEIFSTDDKPVTEADILSDTRGRRAVWEARAGVMQTLHDHGWTSQRIGLYLHRHHTTVLHALGRHKTPSNPL